MKHLALSVSIAVMALQFSGCSDTSQDPQNTNDRHVISAPIGSQAVPDMYIVQLRDDVATVDIENVVGQIAATYHLEVENIYSTVLKGFSASVPRSVVDAMLKDPRIVSISQDQIVKIGTPAPFNRPPGGGTPVQRVSPQVASWAVAAVGTASGVGKRVWMLDTGVDPNHPDLTIDTRLSRNFVKATGLKSTSWQDQHGHGTNWAGIIGAKNDGYDAVGIAAGCTVIAVRSYGINGTGYLSWIYAAMDYIGANAVAGDVVCFWLTTTLDAGVDARIRASAANGVIWVTFAGTASADAMNYSPANTGYNNPNIWTVSGHDEFGSYYPGCNYGIAVDVCAPSANIVTTKLGGGIETVSGGNLCVPHVGGILLVGTMASRGLVANDPDGDPDDMATLAP